MIFDECVPYPYSYYETEESLKRSVEWSKRSIKAYKRREGYGVFGIVQGGMYKDLRERSIQENLEHDFDGYAIGGLAVGEGKDQLNDITAFTSNLLPETKPRYLMRVGYPEDILNAVKHGVDMFDCVLPTRSGRTGLAFTWNGRVNIRNAKYKKDNKPLDKSVKIFDLNKYSKNYINHLFNTNEMLGSMILTLNNINFYQELMFEIRENIKNGTFDDFHNKYIDKL